MFLKFINNVTVSGRVLFLTLPKGERIGAYSAKGFQLTSLFARNIFIIVFFNSLFQCLGIMILILLFM